MSLARQRGEALRQLLEIVGCGLDLPDAAVVGDQPAESQAQFPEPFGVDDGGGGRVDRQDNVARQPESRSSGLVLLSLALNQEVDS